MKVISWDMASKKAVVEIQGKQKELSFFLSGFGDYEHLNIWGVAVRYQSGSKVWNSSLLFWPKSGNISIEAPMDHRRGRRSVSLVGFWEDVKEEYKSQHPH